DCRVVTDKNDVKTAAGRGLRRVAFGRWFDDAQMTIANRKTGGCVDMITDVFWPAMHERRVHLFDPCRELVALDVLGKKNSCNRTHFNASSSIIFCPYMPKNSSRSRCQSLKKSMSS